MRLWQACCLPARRYCLANQRIPQRPSARVIVDNDFAGDPDGLVGLAHQLLSPKTVVPLITVSGLDRNLGGETGSTVGPGAEVAAETVQRLALDHSPPIASGHELGVRGQEPSEAARAIVAEAMREDALPLFFSCGGPLTNLAEALLLEPAIAARMTLIWIGGGGYPDGGWEYNLSADADAARQVIEGSAMPDVADSAARLSADAGVGGRNGSRHDADFRIHPLALRPLHQSSRLCRSGRIVADGGQPGDPADRNLRRKQPLSRSPGAADQS